MNINKNTKGLSEAAMFAAIICILGIMGLYIPFLSFMRILIPTPIIIIGKRYNMKYSLMTLVVSGTIIAMVSNPLIAIISIFIPGIVGVAMGELLNRNLRSSLVLGVGTLIAIVSIGIGLFTVFQISGLSIVENIETILNESFEVQERLYTMSGADEENIATAKQMLQSLKVMLTMSIPAIIIIMGFILAYINILFSILVLKRIGQQVNGFNPFRYFRLPKSASQGVVIIILLTLLTGYLNIVDKEVLTLNLYLLGLLIFGLQGMAVVAYFLRYYEVMNIFKVFIFVMLLLTSTGEMVLVLIGVADIFVDIRKYKKEKESN